MCWSDRGEAFSLLLVIVLTVCINCSVCPWEGPVDVWTCCLEIALLAVWIVATVDVVETNCRRFLSCDNGTADGGEVATTSGGTDCITTDVAG